MDSENKNTVTSILDDAIPQVESEQKFYTQEGEEEENEYEQEQDDPYFLRERFAKQNREIDNLRDPQAL